MQRCAVYSLTDCEAILRYTTLQLIASLQCCMRRAGARPCSPRTCGIYDTGKAGSGERCGERARRVGHLRVVHQREHRRLAQCNLIMAFNAHRGLYLFASSMEVGLKERAQQSQGTLEALCIGPAHQRSSHEAALVFSVASGAACDITATQVVDWLAVCASQAL